MGRRLAGFFTFSTMDLTQHSALHAPDATCTRGQAVTFLYRNMER